MPEALPAWLSGDSDQNLIFPLQGEEEGWKNRIKYAQTRNHSPFLPAYINLPSFWGQDIGEAPGGALAAPGPCIKSGATLLPLLLESDGVRAKGSFLDGWMDLFVIF